MQRADVCSYEQEKTSLLLYFAINQTSNERKLNLKTMWNGVKREFHYCFTFFQLVQMHHAREGAIVAVVNLKVKVIKAQRCRGALKLEQNANSKHCEDRSRHNLSVSNDIIYLHIDIRLSSLPACTLFRALCRSSFPHIFIYFLAFSRDVCVYEFVRRSNSFDIYFRENFTVIH